MLRYSINSKEALDPHSEEKVREMLGEAGLAGIEVKGRPHDTLP